MKEIWKKYRKSILVVCGLLLLCNLLSTWHPYILKLVLDVDFSSQEIETILLKFILVYTSIHIVLIFLKNTREIVTNKVVCSIIKEIRKKVFEQVLKFKMVTFQKYNSSEIYTRLTDDVDKLFNLFFGFIYAFVNNGLHLIFMVIMMFIANRNLAFIGFATVFFVSLVSIKFAKVLGKIDNRTLQIRDQENREYSEIYNKNKLTYLFKLQKQNVKKVNDLLNRELKNRKKYIFVHHFPFWFINVIQAIGIYAILYYVLKVDTSISLGSIYLVLFYTKECKSPLEEIFNRLEELQTCFNSYQRIKILLNEKNCEDMEQGEFVKDLTGDIEFQNVSMKYEKEMVLKNISFIIKQGTKVTIAGRTGVGKTTLTNVLMKLYDIQNGKILIGDYDISQISIQSLRNNISYISQNPYIFADTLRNNVILGNTEITDEQIMDLVKEIGVEAIFEKLPDGLDTLINVSQLSYGELQVIAFIRAILHKANIYIFDEPTSNLDLATEQMLQTMIDKISKESTVIIIAHRKSTIESSDKIIYLKDGEVDKIVNKVPV